MTRSEFARGSPLEGPAPSPSSASATDVASELRELSANLLWIWHPDTIAIFRDIDPDLWRHVNHNPVAFLHALPVARLKTRAEELALEARISFAFHRLHDYLERRQDWGHTYAGPLRQNPVAYFSAEFGLHESLPIYSGGLGTLAGDILKGASDLGIPMVGVGLFYAQGYFNQHLDVEGRQEESYSETPIEHLPLDRVTDAAGTPVLVHVDTRAGRIAIGLWRARVGRAVLLLLDSDVEPNSEADRAVTGRLYGGDTSLRITQELILGVGGMRALSVLGLRPSVLHLNEGHSAFAILEMARQEMAENGIGFAEAHRRVARRTVFTTHTPVEAGHDRFDPALIEYALGPLREQLAISERDLLALGRVRAEDPGEPFGMTVLGLRTAARSNAVSSLHRRVTQRMWQPLWPGRSEPEVPILHVTNGVHVASWLAPAMGQLFDRYLGPRWRHHMGSPDTWKGIDQIDDGELWEVHQTLKARLIAYVQRQVCAQEARRQGRRGDACEFTLRRLDPGVLTVGFARRFATYKRAGLVLADDRSLERLVLAAHGPVQFIFAGKAHPRDEPGKQVIQKIFSMSRDPRFLGRIVLLEDYDINVARHLVQSVDVWLNTPRRPLEASGTSGMKALFNGVLNASVLDGWWAEAYDGANGFAIGDGGEHSDPAEQDRRDGEALYATIEREVMPLYYRRNSGGLPHLWVDRMKNAIRTLAWRFNSDRVLLEYATHCYFPLVGMHTGFDGLGPASDGGKI